MLFRSSRNQAKIGPGVVFVNKLSPTNETLNVEEERKLSSCNKENPKLIVML